MEDKLKQLILLMEIKNEEKFSDFSKSIEHLDKQDINISNDIDLLYKELSKIEDGIKSFDVSEQIKELKSDIENIQLQKGDKGEDGKDGYTPIKGIDYFDGTNGRDGKDGKDGENGEKGEDGSPDTPEQIVEKINTLENVIEIKTIKDFPVIEGTEDIKRQVDTIGNQVLRLLSKQQQSSGGGTWGSITGTLSNQIDLQNELNLKYDASNPAGYITSSALSGYTPTSRTITINGTSYDLSTDRTWSVGTVTSVAALTLGTSGTDLSSTVATGTTTPVITLNVPTASATNRGALSSADWSTFNGKQGTITLTTTGTSGAATFIANTLNIPQYAAGISTLAAIGSSPNANGATISGSTLNLQPADASFGGVVTTAAQTFAGRKTFNGYITIAAGTASAGTAPLKFTAGTNLTTPEAGVVEFTTGNFWFSPTTTNRFRFGHGGSGSSPATNIVIGIDSGTNLTTGSGANTYIGRLSGVSQTTGIGNTGVGSGALSVHTGYTGNTAVGEAALYYGSGNYNVAVGDYAMFSDSAVNTSVGAVAVGANSFYKKSAGNYGIAVGFNAGYTVSSAAKGIYIGYNVVNGGVHTGTNTIAIGEEAGKILTSGAYNILMGYQSGATVTTGTMNNFMGYQSGYNTNSATGYANFIGYQAGYGTSTSASVSNFIGYQAGYNAGYSIQNNFIGNQAGYGANNLADANFIGTGAGGNATTANRAVFIGQNAGHTATNGADTVSIGTNAGRNATGSIESIYMGKNSGYNSVSTGITGDYNLGLGTDTLKALTTGAGNIALGYKVGDTITTGSKNVAIGYDIDYQSNTADGQLTIQNAIFGTGNTGTGTTASTGKIGIYTVAPTCALDVTGGIATSRVAVTAPATTDGNIFSGTYTPTLTGITNVTSSTAYVCQYMRVGNVVTVSGKIEVTPTLNNAQTTIGISLPIASNFASSQQCGGSSHTVANTVAGHGGAIYADATNDRAEMDYFETHGASDTFAFSFTYQII